MPHWRAQYGQCVAVPPRSASAAASGRPITGTAAPSCTHRGSAMRMPPRRASPSRGELRRSEEHTSELQSRLHLVCRLLLEKKKKISHSIDSEKILYYT